MSSSSSSSMGGSLALAAATAVAFSGSLVIFSLCRAHLSHGAEPEPEPTETEEVAPPEHALRPCLASSDRRTRVGKAKTRRRRGEKRVRFAADVVDNEGAPRPTRSSPPASGSGSGSAAASSTTSSTSTCRDAAGSGDRMMPANREALYRGMLRDRSGHRFAYSY